MEDRRIRCHKAGGHGAEDFTKALENSCNPALMEMGLRMGVDRFYQCFSDYGLLSLTGIDIPGEAGTIMHKLDNIGEVELATMTFGQSFQITPVQLAVMASSVINGGRRITPHFGVAVQDQEGKTLKEFSYPVKKGIVTEEVSEQMLGNIGKSSSRRIRKESLSGRLPDRWKDSNFSDLAKKCP